MRNLDRFAREGTRAAGHVYARPAQLLRGVYTSQRTTTIPSGQYLTSFCLLAGLYAQQKGATAVIVGDNQNDTELFE